VQGAEPLLSSKTENKISNGQVRNPCMNLKEADRHHEESFLFYDEDFMLIFLKIYIMYYLCIVIIIHY
jgi:hypothetical protein